MMKLRSIIKIAKALITDKKGLLAMDEINQTYNN